MTHPNLMQIDDHFAVITFDSELERFRGSILGLTGAADFYGTTVKELLREGRLSLKIYLEECEEHAIEPFKTYSGKLALRMPKGLHEAAARAAAAESESLNAWIVKQIEGRVA